MKTLIIGFGSIGKRHLEILTLFKEVERIDVVTKQELKDRLTYTTLEEIKDLSVYDYFVIASETAKHYSQLKYICSKVDNKKVLVEKPLYSQKDEEFTCVNEILTAYNLRFHPVIEGLKQLLANETIYYANIMCGQYLPTWRPEQDYTKSYSADISQGGGVLRDLSHELDYLTWMFGDIETISATNTKISDLDINSDDICTAVAITNRKIIVNFSIDYISKTPIRRVVVHTKDHTIEADVVKNSIVRYDKNSNAEIMDIQVIDRNYTYMKMHKSILNHNSANVCSFEEGKQIINIIENIKFEEL